MKRLGWALLAVLAGCGDSGTEAPVPDTVSLVTPAPTSARVGTAVQLSARVTAKGSPLAGQGVTFTVTGGGGSVFPASAVSDAQGVASTTWTLGVAAGVNALAVAAGSVSLPVTVTTTVPTPARLVLDSVAVTNNGRQNMVVRVVMRNAGEARGMARVQFWA
ncbi:MAG TPA: hypothetical protein VEI97_02630, partial [bacterium]|nr:hypothetical protein [bacterium]